MFIIIFILIIFDIATGKPKIKKASEKEAGRVDEKLVLSVEFTAKPAPEIHWYRNGVELFDNTGMIITKTDKKSTLTIQKLAENDEGDYQVQKIKLVSSFFFRRL